MSALLRRLADWIDDHQPTAGRVHASQLDGLQHRKRDVIYLAVGPLAVLIDLPKRYERPPVKTEPVTLTWTSPQSGDRP